jgi:predicted metalloprotease
VRWESGKRSTNVEDRRRGGGRRNIAIGGGGVIVVALVLLLMGRDPGTVLQSVLGAPEATPETVRTSPAEDRLADMCSVVLADTEDTWNAIFEQSGLDYVEPKLVIYSGWTESGCGAAEASTGPFYCPDDQKVYIDLSFYEELQDRFAAPGDFAQAYVIAHEIGHHVQYLLGTLDRVHAAMARASTTTANQLSVRLELQADFYAGVWAHYADQSRHLLDSGDLGEALNAAAAIGDDRLQQRAQGYAVPESFTHGTSAQRLQYFKLGYDTGDPQAFDLKL